MVSKEVVVGDLVLRGDVVFLVIEIGKDYQEGFALCRSVSRHSSEYWIMKSLLHTCSKG